MLNRLTIYVIEPRVVSDPHNEQGGNWTFYNAVDLVVIPQVTTKLHEWLERSCLYPSVFGAVLLVALNIRAFEHHAPKMPWMAV